MADNGRSDYFAATVKNTFIEVGSPKGQPMPMASAPARSGFSLKESLAEAAQDDAGGFGTIKMRRRKPDPLGFACSTSMVSIQEAPVQDLASIPPSVIPQSVQGASGTKSITGCGSFPSTPAFAWETATPTGTPVAVPSRQTLSLVDMIQSPKADSKMVMLDAAVQQGYRASLPTASHINWQGAASGTAHMKIAPPRACMPPQPVPAQPPFVMCQIQSAPSSCLTVVGPSQPTQRVQAASFGGPSHHGAAAVALGLVQNSNSTLQRSVQMPVGTIQPQQRSMTSLAPVAVGAPLTSASAPVLPGLFPIQANSQYQAVSLAPATMPYSGAGGQSSQTLQRQMPPPPVAPAPAMVVSPAGTSSKMPPLSTALASPKACSSAPVSPENDIKVLLDLAVASGNQEAVNAVLRQAQQQGCFQNAYTP
eukprot:TRINITY_DN27836_c0_g1_i1.p1 TRINITY_DN27836_c0_g1~~TRINITY_DN27836_c0_g1_i1.p1  ORF type:complete len:456 (-),score=62.78 TRINITY_DN27836_c0_g1_i1:138-1403(-)